MATTRSYIEDGHLVTIRVESPQDIFIAKSVQLISLGILIRQAVKAKGKQKVGPSIMATVSALAIGTHAFLVRKQFRDVEN